MEGFLLLNIAFFDDGSNASVEIHFRPLINFILLTAAESMFLTEAFIRSPDHDPSSLKTIFDPPLIAEASMSIGECLFSVMETRTSEMNLSGVTCR